MADKNVPTTDPLPVQAETTPPPKKKHGGIENLRPFTKGDPRINRLGRPKSYEKLRELAQEIAGDRTKDENGETIIIAMFKAMSKSKNPADRKLFLEYAYGKVKEELDITTGGDKFAVPTVIEIIKTYDKTDKEDV